MDRNSGDIIKDALDQVENRFISAFLPPEVREKFSRAYFTVFKLPLILFAIVAGFIFEFMVELPFMMLVFLDYRSQQKSGRRL